MKLQTLITLIAVAMAVWAWTSGFSFWWTLVPTFFAGSLALSNGPHYAAIIEANARGSMTLFPLLLAIYWAGYIALAGFAYWLTGIII